MLPELPNTKNFIDRVFAVTNEKEFLQIALDIFRFQFFHNPIYSAYCKAIGRSPENVNSFENLPFLPISFFKTHTVITGTFEPETIFKSSGTTGQSTSRHLVKDTAVYKRSFLTCFQQFFGAPSKYCILGLLPSYLEQGSSSLVYMVDCLIRESGHSLSGFYLYDHQKLKETLRHLEANQQPAILFGVTYALLHFAETSAMPLSSTILVETGGMKGRKRELTKAELYQQLQNAFSLPRVHSEYGMTELLSQAYAVNGRYKCPPWMKVLLRDETDPFSIGGPSGAINVIDLANLWSCSFIATEDLGKYHNDGSFEVMGRLDNTDIRGCSQLAL